MLTICFGDIGEFPIPPSDARKQTPPPQLREWNVFCSIVCRTRHTPSKPSPTNYPMKRNQLRHSKKKKKKNAVYQISHTSPVPNVSVPDKQIRMMIREARGLNGQKCRRKERERQGERYREKNEGNKSVHACSSTFFFPIVNRHSFMFFGLRFGMAGGEGMGYCGDGGGGVGVLVVVVVV